MNRAIYRFLRDDRGAVVTDWTALTAGLILFGLAVVYAIFNEGVAPVSNSIERLGVSGAQSVMEPVKVKDVTF